MSTGWEDRAEEWIAWARTRDENYSVFRDAFFELLSPGGGKVLEVGCGEGRVSRDLRDRGYRVTGVDAAPTLVSAAAAADPRSKYVVADAAALPLESDSFDLVVAYNSLMDVDDMAGAITEAARVLRTGGRFCACITHPFRDAGTFEGRQPGARFVVEGSYFEESSYELTVERCGVAFSFSSRTYPLGSYMAALEAAGLLLEAIREPEGLDDRDTRMPQFLLWRAVKP